MFSKKELDEIKEEIAVFFDKMGFSVEIEVNFNEEALNVELKSDEPKILIGEGGVILSSIHKVLKALLQRKSKQEFSFNVDVNEYRKKKAQYLKELAKETADRVALSKEPCLLPVMSSFERRIIHLELANRSDVETESKGQDPDRCIEIRPK